MSDGTRGRVKLGELTDAALADVEPAAHAGFVADLALVTRTADAVAAVCERLLAEGDRGRLVFLEWLARLRVRPPQTLLDQLPAVLADDRLPDELRVRAAARVLRSSRSTRLVLGQIVRALTAGRSPLNGLVRLRAVQARLRRSKALDALILRREQRLLLRCPRCSARHGLAAMARHLFEAHGLVLDRGRARRPEKLAKQLRKRYAAARDTTLLDEAATFSTATALRAWAARTRPADADLTPLLDDANGRGRGLCPRCLSELPPSVTPLPPPLTLSAGRLSGEGYTVEVRGPDGLRTCTITAPAGVVRSGLDGRRAVGPRAAGVVAAGTALAAAIAGAWPVGWSVALAAACYAAARSLRGPLPPASSRAVDRCWSDLVPRLPPGEARDRFLIRLCRSSLGTGDPDTRAGALAGTADSADARTRASVRFLQTDDAGRLGVDRTGAVAAALVAGFGGADGVAFAEHVADLFLARGPTPFEAARLRVLALEAAFAAGFTPRALADLWAACPRLAALMGGVPLSRLGVQYAVWAWGPAPPWEPTAGTGTVFEMTRVAPTLAGRLLHEYPDLLLYLRPPPAVDEAHGWVLVCARGVVVGGKLVADPDAELGVEGNRLTFGPYRLPLARRPPASFLTTLRRLLRLRTEQLLPRLDAALTPSPSHPALWNLVTRCSCGAMVLVSPGQVGRAARFERSDYDRAGR